MSTESSRGTHSAEAIYRRTIMKWFARCKCGWYGPDRVLKRNADDDAIAHDIAENAA